VRCSGRSLHTCLVGSPGNVRRFRDPRATEYDFLNTVEVQCPQCRAAARVLPVPGADTSVHRPFFQPRRMACPSCGATRRHDGKRLAFSSPSGARGPATDPYFGLPLWIQARTRHGWLWAYNLEHLMLIRSYVEADLRERANWYDTRQKMTLVARLPVWIKRGKNRQELIRVIDRLRASLPPA
jgi:hypothetical protein